MNTHTLATQQHSGKGGFFSVSGISKLYGANLIVDNISFDVPENAVVTLVGENGAGKSTIFNIISGLTAAASGKMFLGGQAFTPRTYGEAAARGVSRVFQEQALIHNIPVYENLLLGYDAKFLRYRQIVDRTAMIEAAERIIQQAGIDVDVRRRTADYDFSKRQSIEIARACLASSMVAGIRKPLVLLDEPTSALDRRDEDAFFSLVERVKRHGSLLFVSHRLSEVLSISDIIYVLKDGQLVARLDPASTDESMLHGLMVGRERATDYYYEKRQRETRHEAVVFEADGLDIGGNGPKLDIRIKRGEVVGIGGLLDSGDRKSVV